MRLFVQSGLLATLVAFAMPVFAQDAGAVASEATDATEAVAAVAAVDATPATATTEAEVSPALKLIGAPQAGKGQIVFFREKKFVGGAISYKVREGQTEIGKLANGSYFVLAVTPGAHEYAVHSEAEDVFNIEVEAGETYFVSGGVTMGVFAGRPNLSPSDENGFMTLSSKLKRVQPIAR